MLTNKVTLFACLLPLASFTTSYASPQLYPDWVMTNNRCHGMYVEPTYPAIKGSVESQKALPVSISALHSVFSQNGPSILEGDVSVTQGQRQLKANRAEYIKEQDGEVKHLNLSGHLVFTEPGIRVETQSASYDLNRGTFEANQSDYRLYQRHARGKAQKAQVDKDKTIHLKNAQYTTCAPNENSWSLHAKEIVLDPNAGRGYSKKTTLKWGQTPVAYIPFLEFPINDKRKSGFLYPDFGSTTQSGFSFSLPYYFNLKSNYDWTLTPEWLTQRGLNIGNEIRYLTYKSTGTVHVAVLPHDHKYAKFKAAKLAYHPEITELNDPRLSHLKSKANSRFALTVDHLTAFNPQWLLQLNINHVGDDDYYVDLASGLMGANTSHLLNQVDLSYKGTYWNSFFRVQEYETLHPFNGPRNTETYRRQPQWSFDAFYPKQAGLDFTLKGEVTNFAHKKDPFNKSNNFSHGWRYVLIPGLSLPMGGNSAFFTPSMQMDMTHYTLELSNDALIKRYPSKPSRILPVMSLDTGIFFERDISFLKNAYVQTLEPRLFYLNVPNKNQNHLPNFDSGIVTFGYSSLFRTNRFSGHDRVGDANQLTWSLQTRLLDSLEKQEQLKLSLSQIVYFKNAQVTLVDSQKKSLENPLFNKRFSPYILQLYYQVTPQWLNTLDVEWHPNARSESVTYLLAYKDKDKGIFNFSVQQQRIDPGQTDFTKQTQRGLIQSDVSFLWPVTEKINFIGRWHYDYKDNRSIDTLAGLEYSGCCTAFQLSAARYLRPSDGITEDLYTKAIYFQIIFKGLSNLGYNSSDRKLGNRIPGYEKFSKRQAN